ncbi:thiamine phosphate synthase [Terriglobus albidus]|uniref:Thiamine phosphate synthase n=1 Tax=Terriglobus albidus TaxID=1592106 RepID=A0A5B9E774_9BACT|nr:thiamine phosphate synthase [Terriglobus albidus]QEE27394.1 thiamine phosphate synthase [Terriglobus albidus]
MTRCAITNRKIVSSEEQAARLALLDLARRCAQTGIDYLQLREKDLGAAEMVSLARRILTELSGSQTRLLINGRLDVALAAGAHGVHLTSREGELTPAQVRSIFPEAIVSVSCHTLDDIWRSLDADFLLFGPVFEKSVAGERISKGSGLELLREACLTAGHVPVLALGGITAENTSACLEAGAAGIAGIRLFL